MADITDISDAITAAESLALTATQMVALCDRAIAQILATGKPVIGYVVNGREFTFSLFQAQSLRDYYFGQKTVDANPSGMVMAPCEFDT